MVGKWLALLSDSKKLVGVRLIGQDVQDVPHLSSHGSWDRLTPSATLNV